MFQQFESVYARREWGPGSGPGSLPSGLGPYYSFLQQTLAVRRPREVLDLGCGYFSPYAKLGWFGAGYTGLDVVRSVIDHNRRYETEARKFYRRDWCNGEELPPADLVIVKDVLQHWSTESIWKGLKRLKPYPAVLIVNTAEEGSNPNVNGEIQDGGFRPLNLTLAPFAMRAAESFTYQNPVNRNRDLKLCLLWEPSREPVVAAPE